MKLITHVLKNLAGVVLTDFTRPEKQSLKKD